MLGFRKDLLVTVAPNIPDDVPLLTGTKHEKRVLIKSSKCWDLLLRFTGITRDRKKLRNPKQLTHIELKSLCSSLRKDGFTCLADLIVRMTSESVELVPSHIGNFSQR